MNRFFLAAALASTGFTAIAIAPSTAQNGPSPRDEADSVQTRAEAFARADGRFDRMDANRDGKLTAEEMRPRDNQEVTPPANGAAPASTPAAAGTMGDRMFARLDANSDGSISRAEFRAQAARRFDRIDANNDGTIDASERQAARDFMEGRMGKLRTDRGGQAGGNMPLSPPAGAPEAKPGQ